MEKFNGWRDILSWAKENGFERISKRLEINNACWNSSGEFGRSQVAICDAMRFAESEEERISVAEDIEESLKGDIVIGDSNA